MSDPKKYPFHELKASFVAQRREILDAVERVLDGGWYILGKEVQAFEAEFARWTTAKHAIGTANATESLSIGLWALGVRPGDEVVVPALTAAPTAMAVVMTGAVPVFCDIDPSTYLMDPRHLEKVISPRTKVVIPVDLYGQCADYDAIAAVIGARPIAIFEDASQSHGAKDKGRVAGTFGKVAAFSFYPTKNLGAFGDGGAVTTNDDGVAERVRRLRNYGFIDGYDCVTPGMNSRLDEIHAAMLRVKLKTLDQGNERRRFHARRYFNEVKNAAITLPKVRDGAEHVFHQFVVRTKERDRLRAHLLEHGIETLIHYPRAIDEMQCFKPSVDPAKKPREAARAAAEIVSLPIFPEMPAEQQDRTIQAVNAYRG